METKLKGEITPIQKGKKRGRKPKLKEMSNNEEIKMKKKRGRKPKPKTEIEIMEKQAPKKRGRKPKPKHPIELLPRVPKKRGRKPKDKYGYGISQSKIINPINFTTESSNVILHLPIHSQQILDNEFVEKQLLEYDPQISVPTPYNADNTNQLFSLHPSAPYPFDQNNDEGFQSNQENKKKCLKENDLVINQTNNSDNNLSDDDNCENIDDGETRNLNIKFLEKNLFDENDIENDYMEYSQKLSDHNIKITNESSSTTITNTMLQFQEANNRKKWPESTTIHCWWDACPFNSPPCSLPIKKNDNEFTVIGCFCSPECAAAWNYQNNDDDEKWERYALLNHLYRKVYKNIDVNIKLASPREILKIFGGSQTIEEFRKNNSNYNTNFNIVLPPMVSIISQIEANQNDIFTCRKRSFIPIDKERIKKANDDLKLKRSKPLSDKRNTLENCMKLKYI